jgi:phage I-like protein
LHAALTNNPALDGMDAVAASQFLSIEGEDIIAMSEGKLLPVQEEWARNLGKENMASLNQYLASAQPIAAAANKYVAEQAALGIAVTASQAVAH